MSETTTQANIEKKEFFPSAASTYLFFGLIVGILFGFITGIVNLFGSAALPLSMPRLGMETLSRDLSNGLRWGIILALLMVTYSWLTGMLMKSNRRAIIAQLLGLGIWLLGLGLIALRLLRSLGERLPLPYQEHVTPSIFFTRFIIPLVTYTVSTKPVLMFILIALTFAVPMVIGTLIARRIYKEKETEPFGKIPSLAMTKRQALIGAIVVVVALIIAGIPQVLGRPQGKPNVLLISVDTLRADGLHCYGNPLPNSPVIDKLAAEGTRYENIFSSAPWTLPGHVSMLTGLTPEVHNVYQLDRHIPREAPLLSEVFKNAGYKTFAATSNFLVSPPYGYGRGFDRFIFRPEAESGRIADVFLGMLQGTKEPWFGFLHFFDPHLPYSPTIESRQELGIEGPIVDEILANMTHLLWRFIDIYLPYDEAHKEEIKRLYAGEVRDVDRALGRVLEKIDLTNTIVIVTSDHGEEFFEHGWSGHSVVLFDESLRIPLIFHGPTVEAGKVVSQTSDMTVIVPMILAHVGLPDPLQRGAPVLGTGAYGHTNGFGNHRTSWRHSGWSFLTEVDFTYGERHRQFPPGLYDDPSEQVNLIEQNPEKVQEMQDEMDQSLGLQIKKYGKMKSGKTDLDETRLNRLRELGYVQ
ncbi:MAG TPA: sulfatase [bacterium]|nr:sulfatase [bacterium]